MGRTKQTSRKTYDYDAAPTSVAYTNWAAMKAAAPPPGMTKATSIWELPQITREIYSSPEEEVGEGWRSN